MHRHHRHLPAAAAAVASAAEVAVVVATRGDEACLRLSTAVKDCPGRVRERENVNGGGTVLRGERASGGNTGCLEAIGQLVAIGDRLETRRADRVAIDRRLAIIGDRLNESTLRHFGYRWRSGNPSALGNWKSRGNRRLCFKKDINSQSEINWRLEI